MAKIDDLLKHVADGNLRDQLRRAVSEIRDRRQFGLVFEQHIPETVLLSRFRIKKGSLVIRRNGSDDCEWIVEQVESGIVSLRDPRTGATAQAHSTELIVVKPVGEPIYPCLTPISAIAKGGERAWNAVINGENYHAAELLVYLYEGKFDCLYLDPPYNTGAKDWTYNNRFVDKNDSYRHSKWLSMIDKRLRLARRLLKPDGVLIITIDQNELHHLGMLLERHFLDARRQLVTICINPSGASGEGLSRVEEYAFFCFLGQSEPVKTEDDMLSAKAKGADYIRWESLMRGGNAWYRARRTNLCYPVVLSKDGKFIVDVGDPLPFHDDAAEDAEEEAQRPKTFKGKPLAWPVRNDGKLGIWRVDGRRLMDLVSMGFAYVSSRDEERQSWTIRYLMSGTVKAINRGLIEVIGKGNRDEALLRRKAARETTPKTMWHRGRHTAGGAGGTHMLAAVLGERDLFPFPKSLYAVRDCLDLAIGDRKDALILDFFAGSGTTLHATFLMNAEDNGTRRCVLVTNNEVDVDKAALLRKAGQLRGSPEFEREGIFNKVTRPRCEAVVTGNRADGMPVEGEYLDGRRYAQGFDENVEFFSLDYLDPNEITLGRQFDAILPLLWLTAGGRGNRPTSSSAKSWLIPDNAPFAVLLNPDRFSAFTKALADRDDISHVWIVTDDEHAFARMRSQLRSRTRAAMLYREYLRNFIISADRNI